MIDVFHHLMLSATLYMVCAILVGVLFDHLSHGWPRDALVGLLFAAAAAALTLIPPLSGGPFVDAHAPLIIVGALVGGPAAAASVVSAPAILELWQGAPGASSRIAETVMAGVLGLAVWALCRRLKVPVGRRPVLCVALASPLVFSGLLGDVLGGGRLDVTVVVPLLVWTAGGTVILGFAVTNEALRAQAARERRQERLFEAVTGAVPREVFESQLLHQWRLHERYGHEYSYVLMSIDTAHEVREALGAARWEEVRQAVAGAAKRATRDCDVVCVMDFDRFAVLLPHASLPFAIPVARRMQKAAQTAAGKVCTDPAITVSMGCAEVDGTSRPNDVEVGAEGELFLANMREPRGAIGPEARAASDGLTRSFPGRAPEPAASSNANADATPDPQRTAELRLAMPPQRPEGEARRPAA